MALDANVTGTLVNVLSTVVAGIVLGVLGRGYTAITNLLRAVKTYGTTLRTLLAYVRAITDYIYERDGVDISPRLSDKPADPNSGN